MPHRVVVGYLYTFVATGGVLTSLLASVSQSAKPAPVQHPMFAVGEAPVEALSPAMLSWLGFAASASVVAGKVYADYRARTREADIADAAAWGDELIRTQKELGAATARLETAKGRITDLEARNNVQSAEMAVMQSKLAKLASSQNDVITAVNKQQTRVKETVKRVGSLEDALGSTSDMNLRAAQDDGTSLDMPAIQ